MKRVQEKKYKADNFKENTKMILLVCGILKSSNSEAESTRMVARRWEEREIELSNGYKVEVKQDE